MFSSTGLLSSVPISGEYFRRGPGYSHTIISAGDHKLPVANATGADDRFDLNRLVQVQAESFPGALAEMRFGRKRSLWMWSIFPQIAGLGYSSTAKFYAIKSLDEARAYLNHALLGKRLIECAEALSKIKGKSAAEIFGHPEDL
jgi:uncharacterized protein (DUF1810 family)